MQASVSDASTQELSTLKDSMGGRKEGQVHRGRSRPRKEADERLWKTEALKYASNLFKEEWTWKMAFLEDGMLQTKLGSPYRAEQDLGSVEVFRAPLTHHSL